MASSRSNIWHQRGGRPPTTFIRVENSDQPKRQRAVVRPNPLHAVVRPSCVDHSPIPFRRYQKSFLACLRVSQSSFFSPKAPPPTSEATCHGSAKANGLNAASMRPPTAAPMRNMPISACVSAPASFACQRGSPRCPLLGSFVMRNQTAAPTLVRQDTSRRHRR